MAALFVSYSREAHGVVEALAADIAAIGDAVWFDRDLTGGQAWWTSILEKIRDCDAFIAVLDPSTLTSTACKREAAYAAALGKPILPILVSDAVATGLLPPPFGEIQFVDYRRPEKSAAFALARALKGLPKPPPLPTPLPDPPPVPLSYLVNLSVRLDKTSLSFDEQVVLVAEMKDALSDPDPATAAGARNLLREMTKRKDLFARVEKQIAEALDDDQPAAQVDRRGSSHERPTGVGSATPPQEDLARAGGAPKSRASVDNGAGSSASTDTHAAAPKGADVGVVKKLIAVQVLCLGTISAITLAMALRNNYVFPLSRPLNWAFSGVIATSALLIVVGFRHKSKAMWQGLVVVLLGFAITALTGRANSGTSSAAFAALTVVAVALPRFLSHRRG